MKIKNKWYNLEVLKGVTKATFIKRGYGTAEDFEVIFPTKKEDVNKVAKKGTKAKRGQASESSLEGHASTKTDNIT